MRWYVYIYIYTYIWSAPASGPTNLIFQWYLCFKNAKILRTIECVLLVWSSSSRKVKNGGWLVTCITGKGSFIPKILSCIQSTGVSFLICTKKTISQRATQMFDCQFQNITLRNIEKKLPYSLCVQITNLPATWSLIVYLRVISV